MGQVRVIDPSVVALLGLAAVVAWAVVVRRWRYRRGGFGRRLAVVVATGGAVLLTLTGTADAVNSHFAYLPHLADVTGLVTGGGAWPQTAPSARTPTPGRYPRGVVVTLPVPDRGSGFGPSIALAYLPPQYFTEPTTRFPVVYLLHGSPGVPQDWLRGGAAFSAGAAMAARATPVILVMPRVSRAWLDDPECVDGVHERAETHVFTDVVPAVDQQLRTRPDRGNRTLAGMSAGGYCALNLGLKHRDVFAAIIDMSGLTGPTHSGGWPALYGRGPGAYARYLADDPAHYAGRLRPGPPVRVWLDTGTGDRQVRRGIEMLARALPQPGVSVELHERPGGHNFTVWAPALRAALPWAVPPPSARSS